MLPILIGVYKLEQKKAVATSLVIVGLSSLASFFIQISKGADLLMDQNFIGLIFGILITSYLIKLLSSKISEDKSELLRKTVFTLVVALSLVKIF